MPRLFLIDGSAITYRSYFAFIRNPLRTKNGINISAIFGFTNSLFKILNDEKPEYLAVVFDRPEPTFRDKLYADYKATREKMPDELVGQLPHIKDVIEGFNIPLLELPGYEADDIMATLALEAERQGLETYLVTSDKDLMQIISDKIRIYNPRKAGKEIEIIDAKGVEEKFRVKPSQVRDLLALMGDSSDNIPGIRGIGEKKAADLLQALGDLDTILNHPEKIKSKSDRAKVESGRESALLSKQLATLDTSVPVSLNLHELQVRSWNDQKLRKLFREWEFDSFLKILGSSQDSGVAVADVRYKAITSKESLNELCNVLRDASDGFTIDLETTSAEPMLAEIVGLSFAFREKEAFYVPVRCPEQNQIEFTREEALASLKSIIENPALKKCGQNIKYDMLVLRRAGINLKGLDFDTMVAAYVINPGARHYNLDALAENYFSYIKIPTSELIGSGRSQKCMDEVPLNLISRYACEDADFTLRLRKVLAPKVESLGMEKLLKEIEIPLIAVLAEMEYNGVSLDMPFLQNMSGNLEIDLRNIEKEIYECAGEQFNINSPQQLGKIIYEKLKVHEHAGIKRIKKTKTGYSTDVVTLERLANSHPIIQKILDCRQVMKLKSTYVDALPSLVNPHTGRVHTSFNQTIAATGRLSSSNPNLQNIPIRSRQGREIRKAFIPRKEGWVIMSADYSQIELRLAAHLSGDRTLIDAFQKREDIHTRTASLIFHVDPEEVTPEMRYKAKAINFGIIYGMGPDRLAREVQISRNEAQEFIDAYFINYPGVNIYIGKELTKARELGYVTTLLGRRRFLPELNSDNQQERNSAENIAINTPIQGTAADIIKIAMINLHNYLINNGLSSKMVLQIHDELVFEIPQEELEILKREIPEKMELAVELDVPVKVEIGKGNNWFEAH